MTIEIYFYGKIGSNPPSNNKNPGSLIGTGAGFMGSMLSFSNMLYCSTISFVCDPDPTLFFPFLAANGGF